MPARSRTKDLVRIFDRAVDPVYVVDDRRRIVYANDACAQWIGQPLDSLVGAECRYHSQPASEGQSPIAALLCPPPQAFSGERSQARIEPTTPGATVRTIEFLPLTMDDDAASAVLAIATDESVSTSADAPDSLALHERVAAFHRAERARYGIERLAGSSLAMRRLRAQVDAAARSAANVLIVGPPGSGRQQLARTIHYATTPDNAAPLVPLACSMLTAELLQTTIRSLLRPATARGTARPTLLLADVDLLDGEARAELVGFLRLAELPLRLVSTARQPISELPGDLSTIAALDAGLATLTIDVPPLAERIEDLPLLAQLLLEQVNAQSDKQLAGFTPEALERLAHYPWPGQLRELSEGVAHAHAHASTAWVAVDDLPRRIFLAASAARNPRPRDETIQLEAFLGEIERELVIRALDRAGGNKTRAAKLLGMTRPRLYRRMVQLGLVQLGLVADEHPDTAGDELEEVDEFVIDDEDSE